MGLEENSSAEEQVARSEEMRPLWNDYEKLEGFTIGIARNELHCLNYQFIESNQIVK